MDAAGKIPDPPSRGVVAVGWLVLALVFVDELLAVTVVNAPAQIPAIARVSDV